MRFYISRLSLISCFLLLFASSIRAEDGPGAVQNSYINLEPDIITNYVTDERTLGFVRITVSLLITDPTNLGQVQHHLPLLRDAIIKIIGSKSSTVVKSRDGREDIRVECELRVNELLVRETGKKMVDELIFTKYIYQ